MEHMLYQPETDGAMLMPVQTVRESNWRHALPTLGGKQVVLREPRLSDAASLFSMLTTEEVARFISPPPMTQEGFERFIAWTLRQRSAGEYACLAVTLRGFDTAIGIFQVRQLSADFKVAEWGFAIGSPFWGTGVFQEAARLVLEFVFDHLGVHRLEARASVENGRGNAALRKMGAVKEGILRGSLIRDGQAHDQVLYAILADDWRTAVQTPMAPSLARYVH
jgi:ribosomal-protein-alanine N-acetyltransferase